MLDPATWETFALVIITNQEFLEKLFGAQSPITKSVRRTPDSHGQLVAKVMRLKSPYYTVISIDRMEGKGFLA